MSDIIPTAATPTMKPSDSMSTILWSTENPVFSCYLFWCNVLVIKMLIMSLLTAMQRFLKKTELNEINNNNNNSPNMNFMLGKIGLLWSLFVQVTRMGKIVKLACAFVNSEDTVLGKVTEVKTNDPDVERVRRAHLNDLENILPFLIVSLAYIAMDPHPVVARTLFRIATVSRIFHTLVYAFRPVPQPTRAIAFFVTFFITMYMAFYTAVRTMRFI